VRVEIHNLLWKGEMRFTDICLALLHLIKSRRIVVKYLKKFMKEGMIKRNIDSRQYELTFKGEKMVSKYIKELLIGIIDDIEHMKIKSAKWHIMNLIYHKGQMSFEDMFERIREGNYYYTIKNLNTLTRYLKELMKEGCLNKDIDTREYVLTPKGKTIYLSIEHILSTPWQTERNTIIGEMTKAPCYNCKFIKWKKKQKEYECGLLNSLTDEEADKLIEAHKKERACPFFVIAEGEKRGF